MGGDREDEWTSWKCSPLWQPLYVHTSYKLDIHPRRRSHFYFYDIQRKSTQPILVSFVGDIDRLFYNRCRFPQSFSLLLPAFVLSYVAWLEDPSLVWLWRQFPNVAHSSQHTELGTCACACVGLHSLVSSKKLSWLLKVFQSRFDSCCANNRRQIIGLLCQHPTLLWLAFGGPPWNHPWSTSMESISKFPLK